MNENTKRSRNFLRRKYLIDPKVQLGLTAYFVSFALLTILGIYFSVLGGLHATFRNTNQILPKCSALLEANQDNVTSLLNTIFLWDGVALLIFATLGGILIAHRIVGPIYRIRKVLEKISSGEDPGTVRFRKHDFFKDLAPQIDALVRLKERGGKPE